VSHAEKLNKLYNDAGIIVKAIHYEKSPSENEVVLSDLRSRRINGIVAVGMAGEGLDIPNIKLAVFHRNPQSLPHTIQLIGRLARSDTKIEQGAVVGYSDDFSRDTFKLYEKSPDWLKLIPYLEQKLIGKRVGFSEVGSFSFGENYIYDADLNPYYTISAMEWIDEPTSIELNTIKNWSYSTEKRQDNVVYISDYENDTYLIITRTQYQPDWLISKSDSFVQQERYDLHIIYQNKKIILEYTTDSQIMSQLRKNLFGVKLTKVSTDSLNQALTNGDGSYIVVGLKNSSGISYGNGSYIVVGLKNSSGISYGNPTYKMLMGREAQDSVRNSDNKIFFPGHALMRLQRANRASEIRGIAYKNSRVWALRRANIKLFRDWCYQISSLIQGTSPSKLPGLERLRRTSKLSEFPQKPMTLLHNSYLLNRHITYLPNPIPNDWQPQMLGDLIIRDFDKKQIAFSVENIDSNFIIKFDNSSDIKVSQFGDDRYTVIIDPLENVLKRFSIEEYFNKFLPLIIFPDGSSISDGIYSKPNQVPILNESILTKLSWDTCDIHSEEKDTSNGMGVQNFILNSFIPSQGNNILTIQDHASYEIADIITIDFTQNHIALYHIKSACRKKGVPQKPGARKSDMENVLNQGITSTKWVKNSLFAEELLRRVDDRGATKIINGSPEDLQVLKTKYSPALFSFEVVIVQPALDSQKLTDSLKTMIATVQDNVISSQSSFRVLCS